MASKHIKNAQHHYQTNTNQKYKEVSPHSGQKGHHQKNLQTINAGENVEERQPSYTVGGNVKLMQPLWRTVGSLRN